MSYEAQGNGVADHGDVVQATASHTIRRTGGAGSGGVRHALGLSPTSRLSRCATSGKLTSDESPRAARCTLACGSLHLRALAGPVHYRGLET